MTPAEFKELCASAGDAAAHDLFDMGSAGAWESIPAQLIEFGFVSLLALLIEGGHADMTVIHLAQAAELVDEKGEWL
ncbi:MAG TPA: hypothetical protein VF377_10355 [Acidimicrobiia bacterium]